MNSEKTGFEEDEHFFSSYENEQECSIVALEFDITDAHGASEEQLAHSGRFRRPVAMVVTALALFSLMALTIHGSRPDFTRSKLEAHYGAARPASETALVANISAGSSIAPRVPAPVPALTFTAPGELLTGPDSSTERAFISMLTCRCLRQVHSDAPIAHRSHRRASTSSAL